MSNIDTINVGGVDFGIGGTPGLFYDSYEEAETDLANIEDGTLVYTPEPDSTIQDIIDGMTSLHLVGTQRGTGSTNVTVITESSKRLLAITKKSGVIVETKEIPTSVLESGDVVLLGNTSPVIGTKPTIGTTNQRLLGSQLNYYKISDQYGGLIDNREGYSGDAETRVSLSTDLSATTGASITYNGLNSFTITVTDSTLSVYLYTDMLVLGGSASGRNVSFDASGTDLSSTDVEGAIKEINDIISSIETGNVTNSGQTRSITLNGRYKDMKYFNVSLITTENTQIPRGVTFTAPSTVTYQLTYTSNYVTASLNQNYIFIGTPE